MEDWLQKFIRVVEAGSFTKAAERLHVSQPALTIAVGKLEKHLKTELIVRGVRPLTLTDSGKIVYEAGVAQAHVLDNLQTKLNDFVQARQTVGIGMIDSVASMIATHVGPLDALEKNNDVSITVNNSRLLRQSVLARELDAALTVASPKNGDVAHMPMGREALVMVCAPSQAESRQNEIDNGYVRQFISYDQQSMTAQLILDDLFVKGIAVNTTFYSTSPDVITRIVMNGRGVAVLPYLTVKNFIENGSLALLRKNSAVILIYRSVEAIHHPAKQLSASLKVFLEDVKKTMHEMRVEAEAED